MFLMMVPLNHSQRKADRDEKTITLQHGEKLIFGKEKDKAIILKGGQNGLIPEVVNVADVSPDDIPTFDEAAEIPALAYLLSQLCEPEFPVPLGVFRKVAKPTYEDLLDHQIEQAKDKLGEGELSSLLEQGDIWEVN